MLGNPGPAARHVADVNKTEGLEISRRQLGQPRHGPAPWEMTETAYVEELARVETAAAASDTGPPDDEWGPVRSREEEHANRRLDELVPPRL